MNNNAQKVRYQQMAQDLSQKIICQMMDVNKNTYDNEVKLPEWSTTENKKLNRGYNIANRDSNSQNKKRRENRLNTIEIAIKENRIEDAKKYIKKTYQMSIKTVVEKADCCAEKTGEKLIASLFKMVKCDIHTMPEMMCDEMIEILRKWIGKSKKVYNYIDGKKGAWSMIESDEDVIDLYELHIVTKKFMLIESKNKEDYEAKIQQMYTDKTLCAIYEAARELKRRDA